MIYLYWFLFFLISTLPGVYAALNKNFIYTLNPKYNFFAVRLFFIVPCVSISILTSSIFLIAFLLPHHFSSSIFEFSTEPSEVFMGLLIPLAISLLLILLIQRYVLPTEKPEIFQRNNFEHDLFVYFPKSQISGGKTHGTKFGKVQNRRKGEAPIQKQLTELIVLYEEVKEIEAALSDNGEIVIAQSELDFFIENNITGYILRPVKLSFFKGTRGAFTVEKESDLTYIGENQQKYFQIITPSVLPPLSRKTKIKLTDGFAWNSKVVDSKFYYSQNILEKVSDFN